MSKKVEKLSTGQIIFGLVSGLFIMYGIFITTPTEGTPILEVIAWGCLSLSAFVGWYYLSKGDYTNE